MLALCAAPLFGQQLRRPVAGRFGGHMVVAIGSEPRTLNPLHANDSASRLLLSLTMGDLMHINAATQQVEPALATAVDHRDHGRRWIIHLRHDVRFSDGVSMTADDVVFSFNVYTDPKVGALQRDLLLVNGAPVRARALDPWTVELDLPGPYAVGDRLFDGVWILPKHRLEAAWKAGRIDQAWNLATPPGQFAVLGPFIPEHWQAGRGIVLKRNPWYWQCDASGRRLPFLDQLELLTVADPNLQLTLLARRQIDGLSQLPGPSAAQLMKQGCCRVLDAGPGLNPVVLAFNLDDRGVNAQLAQRIHLFQMRAFREAVSRALDRQNLVRNVYAGKAHALATITSPAERSWADGMTPAKADPVGALGELGRAGFRMDHGTLRDPRGQAVRFSLIVPSTNHERLEIASFVQEDLRRIGITMDIVPLDFNSYVEHLLHRHDFEATLIGLGFPDADPNVESSIWRLDGSLHLWRLKPAHPAPWAVELDRLFRQQMVTLSPARRHALYHRMQQIEHEQLPLIPLVAPDVLVAVAPGIQGAQAALLDPHLLWNAQALSWKTPH